MLKNIKKFIKRKQKKQQQKAKYRKTRQQDKTRYYTSEQILSNCSLSVLDLLSGYRKHKVPYNQIKQMVHRKPTGMIISDPIKKTKTFKPFKVIHDSIYGSYTI